jgi:hypothetical protein
MTQPRFGAASAICLIPSPLRGVRPDLPFPFPSEEGDNATVHQGPAPFHDLRCWDVSSIRHSFTRKAHSSTKPVLQIIRLTPQIDSTQPI